MSRAAAFCTLESGEKMVGNAVQQGVSIVKARRSFHFYGFSVKKISNSSNTVEMEICLTTSLLQVVFQA